MRLKPLLFPLLATSLLAPFAALRAQDSTSEPLFNDSHFHLTNYVQEGTDIRDFLAIMGDSVGRSTLFGIPLQQTWSHRNSGDYAPTYYLHSDAPLYYYSFTDAIIAHAYLSLPDKDRQRFDPMITGFNPADMYAADHIRRVLMMYPGVFSGIGEFTIHKEFVSSKVAGKIASLQDPALDRILELCAETGLIAIIHNDIDVPFASDPSTLVYLKQMVELLARHPDATIIWAHMGLGRVVRPVHSQASAEGTRRVPNQLEIAGWILDNPDLSHVYLDISWDEVAKYAVRSEDAVQQSIAFMEQHADRVLFGTDNVAPTDRDSHLRVYRLWDPIWSGLSPEASRKIRLENYRQLFDAARSKVRAWEARQSP
jgi:hypothetical protein